MPPPGHNPPARDITETGDVERTARGLVKLWPLVGPIVLGLVGLGFMARTNAAAITRLEVAVASKASTSDLSRAASDLRDVATRVDREADKREDRERELREVLSQIQRDLERVCARVQCGR